MHIVRVSGSSPSVPMYDMKGLTAGEIMAIRDALNDQKQNGTLGPEGEDALFQFERACERIIKR